MEEIIEEKNQFLISLIVEAVKGYYQKLDQDISLEDPLQYTSAFMLLFIQFIAKATPNPDFLPFSFNVALMRGKVIIDEQVSDNKYWVQVNGFIIDLTTDKQDRVRLEFDEGIVSKLKEDRSNHYTTSTLQKASFHKMISAPYVFNNGKVDTILNYVKEVLMY